MWSGTCAYASDETAFAEAFSRGLRALEEAKPAEAQKSFLEALEKEPGNTAAATNLALSYARAQDFGRALAYFRRVLALEPGLREAREGLEFSQSKLLVKELPHRIELSETLHQQLFSRVRLSTLLAMTALLLLTSGWLGLRWLGDRRRARRAEEAPPAPGFKMVSATLLTLFFAGLSVGKGLDQSDRRATVIEGPVDVLSAPGQEGVKIAEFHPGFEVLVRRNDGEWAQVTYPGGPTGWIPLRHVIAHREP
jgi:hypothetical protein